MLGCFVINLLNNKTIILLNLAEYHLILADEAVRPSRLSIRRYSARFRGIIVKYSRESGERKRDPDEVAEYKVMQENSQIFSA